MQRGSRLGEGGEKMGGDKPAKDSWIMGTDRRRSVFWTA